jgi:hypothetical protein
MNVVPDLVVEHLTYQGRSEIWKTEKIVWITPKYLIDEKDDLTCLIKASAICQLNLPFP